MITIPTTLLKAALAGALGLTACPAPKPAAPPVVTFWEWEADSPNFHPTVNPPTRMDILMNWSDPRQDDDEDAEAERCLSWGGEPILNPTETILICEGVDY
jgi:hypothetical protein